MLKVEISPKVYTNLPPTLVLQAKKELERELEIREHKLRAKKKWLEIIIVGGHKIGMGCHKIGDTVRVSKIETWKAKKR